MKRLLAFRRPLAVLAGLGAVYLATWFFPNLGRAGNHGVVLMGAIGGLLTALTAFGIVLIYRTQRIVNFTAAALGGFGAAFGYFFVILLGWPYPLALVMAILISALIGVVANLILVRFFDAPRLVLTVATVGILGILGFQISFIPFYPIWGTDNPGAIATSYGEDVKPFGSFGFEVKPFTFEFGHVLVMVLVPLALLGVGLFLKRTKLGAAVRASSENADRAEMLGINVKVLSMLVWAMAGGLAGLGVTLAGTIEGFGVVNESSLTVLLPAFAAAVLGSMRSLPTAALAAIGVTILQRALSWSYPEQSGAIFAALMLAIVVAGPLLMRRRRVRDREESSWEAAEETRPVPPQLSSVPEVRTWRNILIGIGVAAVLLFPWVSTVAPTNLAGFAAITGIVMLSLIVLTGWTGQVSLGHWGLVAVGALVGGALTSKAGIPFWIAVPIGATITAALAGLLAIPALRIRGLMLAVTTFAFAFVAHTVLFNETWFGWLIPESVERPTLLLIDFEDERSMYYLSIAFLVLAFLIVRALRNSRPGRILLAMRENEDDLAAIGINPVFTRISAFVLSGFLAGMAGVVLAHHQRAVSAAGFEPLESLNVFLFTVIGGLGAPAGALLGSFVRMLETVVPADPILQQFLNPATGVIFILYVAPRGLWGVVQSMRDSVLRVVAQRRGILAPSLFADMDAEAIEKRLVLMAEPQEGRGLEGLGRRYRLESVLHGTAVGQKGARGRDEQGAFKTAADTMFERVEQPEREPATTPAEEGR